MTLNLDGATCDTLVEYCRNWLHLFGDVPPTRSIAPTLRYWKTLADTGERFTGSVPERAYPAVVKTFVKWRQPRKKECHYNAQLLMLEHGVPCYEGVMYNGTIPIEHSWNVFDGAVIDVTLDAADCYLKREHGTVKNPSERVYLGLPIRRDVILDWWTTKKMSNPLLAHQLSLDA